MLGAVFRGDRVVELQEFPDPRPGPRDVVLKVEASGVCGSDLHLYRRPPGPNGYPTLAPDPSGGPVIAGHEPCGTVVERGSAVGEGLAPIGLRAIVFHYSGCGRCVHCWSGWPQLCEAGSVGYGGTAHGGHAEYIVVPAGTLVPLPEGMTFEVGACLACGTGTAFTGLKRAGLRGGETIAIVGQGPVGLSATLLAAAMGARVIAIDINDERLALAADLGAAAALNTADTNVLDEIRSETRGRGCARALETSGSADGRATAVRSVETWGTVGFVGLGSEPVALDFDRDLIMTPRTVVGSRTFSIADLAQCAELVIDRHVPIERIVSHRYQLQDVADAYRRCDTQAAGKIIVTPTA